MNTLVAKVSRQRHLFVRFAFVCALVALALLLLPVAAHADGYSMTQTYIGATVEADGSLTVVEGRQFDFDDDINGVFWEINTGTNQQGGTATVDVLSVEEDDTAFNKVDSANKGDDGVYTVEQSDDGVRIKVFSPHESGGSAIFYVSYTMTGAVMNWSDTAELYWKFVGDGWSADSDDVEMEVYFANAAGTAAVKGDNFRAWGHGPLTGDVSLDADEPMVTYTIPCVHQGEFAEARIAFPGDWVPQLAASGEERMSTILSEEKEWADEANARRAHTRMIANALAALSVVAAVAFTGTIVVLKLRRPKPKPLFQDEYFRDVPSADHPAVLAALMSWNNVPDQAYIATLMKLTDDRVIKLEEATEAKKKGLLRREKEEHTYRITVTDEAWKAVKKDGIDRDVLKVFFAGVKPDKDGVRSRTFSELEEYASERTTSVGDKLEDYQSTVKGKLEAREFIASDGTIAMVAGLVLGIIIVFGILGSLIYTDFADANVGTAMISIPVTIVGFVLSCTFRRYTPEGAEVAARCKALKHWLEDFTRLKEAIPSDLILWNKLLVMGVALGVSKEVLRQLAEAVPPEVREADGFYDNYPCYWWYYHHYGTESPLDSFNDVYHESIRELASSSDSSSGGSGGGFSGGGGGGVGGGGGGTF